MTVYLAIVPNDGVWFGQPWHGDLAQLFADTEDELHQFADEIGLPRNRYMAADSDGAHYVLNPHYSTLARRHGAKSVNRADVLDIVIGKALLRNAKMIRNMAPPEQQKELPHDQPEPNTGRTTRSARKASNGRSKGRNPSRGYRRPRPKR